MRIHLVDLRLVKSFGDVSLEFESWGMMSFSVVKGSKVRRMVFGFSRLLNLFSSASLSRSLKTTYLKSSESITA